jgi:hypothetical protein
MSPKVPEAAALTDPVSGVVVMRGHRWRVNSEFCPCILGESTMGVLLQAFFTMPPNLAVPSPADGDLTIDWWWDHLASQASELRQSGFTAIWLPPVLKTSDGDKPGSDG